MSINLGNKKFKKLYRGSDKIIELYKGDDLIFEDFEAKYGFKFTIDTRLTSSGQHTSTNKSITIYNWGGGTAPTLLIDWGDGTRETKQFSNNGTSHTYADAGEYQIMLLPTTLVDGRPQSGWLGIISLNRRETWVSVDTPYPANSIVFGSIPPGWYNFYVSGNSFESQFKDAKNITSVPEDLYDNLVMNPTSSFLSNGLSFNGMFQNFGANTGVSPYPVAKKLFAKFTGYEWENYKGTFNYTFSGCKYPIPEDIFVAFDFSHAANFQNTFFATFAYADQEIPAGLFSTVDTSSATRFDQCFRETFDGYQNHLPPANLFSSFNTSNALRFDYMFSNTFRGCGSNLTTGSLPAGLFSFMNTSKATMLKGVFSGTFSGAMKKLGGIPLLFPEFDLSACTTTQEMFADTFQQFGQDSTAVTAIPSGLFKFKNVNVLTNVSGMFQNAFQFAGQNSNTSITVPSGLIVGLDTSRVTNFSSMFFQTFRYMTGSNQSTGAAIPADLFSFLSTSNGVDFSKMFQTTFSYWRFPSGGSLSTLFSTVDPQNGQKFDSMFDNTFSYVTNAPDIPSGLFTFVNKTSRGTTFYYMFQSCFYQWKKTSGTIPAGLFDSIDTSNGTGFSSMFSSTFYQTFSATSHSAGSTTAKIPAGLFDYIDTTNGQSFNYMFSNTFYEYSSNDTDAIIPPNLFDSIVTTNGTSFRMMFYRTFYAQSKTAVTIPTDLFVGIDFTKATDAREVFKETFAGNLITSIPAGLFGGLHLSTETGSKFTDLFSSTFLQNYSINWYGTTPAATITDVFSGETDFSWVDASNAHNHLYQMFGRTPGIPDTQFKKYTGSANTVLQHFNFTPATRTQMFADQDVLTDYATINANWK